MICGRSDGVVQEALAKGKVSSRVVDIDINQKGLIVDTDYIIIVETTDSSDASIKYFISKRYSQFRGLVHELRRAVERYDGKNSVRLKSVSDLANIIESEPTKYFGKLNYVNVKRLSDQRTHRLNDALRLLVETFPQHGTNPMTKVVETFFLTDCVVEEERESSLISDEKETAIKGNEPSIHAMSKKLRKSTFDRQRDEKVLQELGQDENLVMDEDQVKLEPVINGPLEESQRKHAKFSPSQTPDPKARKPLLSNSIVIAFVFALSIAALRHLSTSSVVIDRDIAALICFICFCIGRFCGLVESRETVAEKVFTSRKKKSRILSIAPNAVSEEVIENVIEKVVKKQSIVVRKSMMALIEEDVACELDDEGYDGSLPSFLTTGDVHCCSEPIAHVFHVRGPTYLADKLKVSSGPFLCPMRGVDLFLTDNCPENIGRNPKILRGQLREKPTFIINFRLPWGALILYFDIPTKFLPFLKQTHSSSDSVPSTQGMSAAELTLCKFFMGSDQHRNETFKIIPMVVEGPVLVRSSLRGRPAIIGKKLPVRYVYQPKDEAGNAEYFEVDLDIAALSRARKILSICRSYTQGLTMDVAFVVQGNTTEELPEQMLCGARLHSIDLVNAPLLPPMPELDLDLEPMDENHD